MRPIARTPADCLLQDTLCQLAGRGPIRLESPGNLPLLGVARVLFHVEEAGYLMEPIGIAAASVVVFLGRKPWPLFLVWALLVAGLVLTYPLTRGAVLRQVYLGIELAALVVAIGAIGTWVRRREPADPHHAAMGLVVAIDLVIILLGPWRYPLGVRWDLALYGEIILFGILILVQGGVLYLKRPS
jgi:hypothetical protein